MKKLLLLSILLLFSTASICQVNFELPENIILKSEADFAKYEAEIVKATNWLEESDLNKEIEKRKEVNAFIIEWVSGSPNITVEVNEPLVNLCGENNQLLALFLASYSKYYIENKGQATKLSATRAGVISMIKVYKKGISIVKNKEMDKAVKAFENGKIDDFIKSKFS